MARVFPNICYYISEKELKREKIGYFLSWSLRGCSEPASQACEVARSLQARLASLQGFYDRGELCSRACDYLNMMPYS